MKEKKNNSKLVNKNTKESKRRKINRRHDYQKQQRRMETPGKERKLSYCAINITSTITSRHILMAFVCFFLLR
jgi:hypothetical protein